MCTIKIIQPALKRTAEIMITLCLNMQLSSDTSRENSPVLRIGILLPKSAFSCIVVLERDLRICPDRLLFTGIILSKGAMPRTKRLKTRVKRENHLKLQRLWRYGLIQPASFK